MIGKCSYIQNISPKHQKQMSAIGQQQKLKKVPDILFFCMEKYLEQQKEIDRLNRIIIYKQNKIEKLLENETNQKTNP